MKKVEILEYATNGAWKEYCEAVSRLEKEPESEYLNKLVERHSENHQELYDMWIDELKEEIERQNEEINEPSETSGGSIYVRGK